VKRLLPPLTLKLPTTTPWNDSSWFHPAVRALQLFSSAKTLRPLSLPPADSSLLEEKLIEIRPVNLAVAQDACLEKRILVVEARRSRRSAEARLRVALQAKHVHIAHLQHVRVRPAVRRVARLASLHLDRLMFEHERPLLVRVALETDHILRRRRSQLMRSLRPVRIVAVRALHQSFVHSMVERHVELRLLR